MANKGIKKAVGRLLKITKLSLGINIGYGFGDTTAASENLVIYDGKAHKLDDVTIYLDRNDYLKPWKITSSDGRFEMDFKPVFDRASETDYKIIGSWQHQVFGYLKGTIILDDGTKLQLDEYLCAVEVVRNKY